ncbi:hypothetical protein [Piscinibacter sakaiensis]|uniref:hypothetical protein n=1 Tax=Piscinibacter sakaiensis TaxID=1547922 RepID=UPI003AAE246E
MSADAMTTVHCQPCAGATVGFVFICPGRFEANRGYPCAAGTGANLARALVELNRRAPEVFRSPQRSDYLVTNAWSTVEYPALTGRSVPSEAEVLAPANLDRLAAEIAQLQTVVACGAQAHAALRAISLRRPELRVAYARHLSQRSVNMIPGGSDTPQRIARWVDLVLAQIAEADAGNEAGPQSGKTAPAVL